MLTRVAQGSLSHMWWQVNTLQQGGSTVCTIIC